MSQTVLSALHILILHESTDLAEQLINSLRNAGHATRGHHISAEDDLSELLQKKAWDMLLARPETKFLSANDAILHVQKMEKDIPIILLLNEGDDENQQNINSFLQQGAQDAIPENDSKRLQLVVARELENLTNRRKMRSLERSVKETEKRSSQLLNQSKDAIAYITDGMHIYANQAYIEIFGFEDKEDIDITPVMDLIAPDAKNTFKKFLKNSDNDETKEITLQAQTIKGEAFDATLYTTQAEYDGEACTQIKIPTANDDSDLAKQLEAYKNQDMVTGLPNQHVFDSILDDAVEKAAKDNGTYAIFNIRIDNFHKTTSLIGVSESELLLTSVAQKLQSYFPEPQFLAHFGSEVFSAIDYSKGLNAAKEHGELIRNELSEHMFEIGERTVQITVSIGIAFINDVTTNGDVILDKAYEACHLAYDNGNLGNAVNAYEPAITKQTVQNINVAETLQSAMDSGRLEVLYQPIINLKQENEESYEVFMRVFDEEHKEISLTDYLDGMSTDKIGEKIDRWIILQAIKALAEKYNKGHNVRLFINITNRTMLDKTLAPWLSVALKAARLTGDTLVFQLAEMEATSHLKQAAIFSKELSSLKCKIAVKHFGCSLNPLNIVQHMNVDYFKVDRSFVHDLESSDNKASINALITQAHEREKEIIVPFIENAAMLSSVWQLGADYIQGYYFQEPHNVMDYDFSGDGEE